VMLAVPAATACARVGDLDDAHRFLESAKRSVSRPRSIWRKQLVFLLTFRHMPRSPSLSKR